MSWFNTPQVFTKCSYLSIAFIFLIVLEIARAHSDIVKLAGISEQVFGECTACEASCLGVGSVLREGTCLPQECMSSVVRSGLVLLFAPLLRPFLLTFDTFTLYHKGN